MARIILKTSLVNGTVMPDRTLSADELVRRLVGDDLRPPPLALYLQIETDDGKVVNAIISGDGSGPVTATVSS